nr:TIGR01777 family oxidoreductase [Corynebacterium yonathiae]
MTPVQQAKNLGNGTSILRLPGGLQWKAQHVLSRYQEGYSFSDECVNSPLRQLIQWRHTHTFAEDPAGTRVTDEVDTRVPSAALKSVFAYRQHQLIEDFAFFKRLRDAGLNIQPLTIAMTGSRGSVGTALTAQLRTAGHTVIQLVRGKAGSGQRHWNTNFPDPHLLDGVDVLVHLAGEPIFGRFNEEHKAAILDSRVGPTESLARLAGATPSVHTMVCASAVGFYGADRGDEILTEDSAPGDGFLANVVRQWEGACEPARAAGTRVINIRTGIAMAGNSGLLPLLRALFSTGLGGPFGDGNFWFSWVAIDDLTDTYFRAIVVDSLSGPVNATSPNPVLNKDFVAALGKELHRPAIVPVPSFGPALLLGREGAQELALAEQRVAPTVLTQLGHTFRYPTIDAALAHELGGESLV